MPKRSAVLDRYRVAKREFKAALREAAPEIGYTRAEVDQIIADIDPGGRPQRLREGLGDSPKRRKPKDK
jgi:hypothetical protein